MMFGNIIPSFIPFTGIGHIFIGIDATWFKIIHASEHYVNRARLRSKFAKLSLGADVLKQRILDKVKIRRELQLNTII